MLGLDFQRSCSVNVFQDRVDNVIGFIALQSLNDVVNEEGYSLRG